MRLGFAILLIFLHAEAFADLTSYHFANPVGWRHLLPVGETPGWSAHSWFNLELNEANIWSTPMTLTDRRNGHTLTYHADYEQSSAIADIGFQILPRVALAFELPYANHNGGFLDGFIDGFHETMHIDRFERNQYAFNQNSWSVATNGKSTLGSAHGEGLGGFKLKLKLWLLEWRAKTPDVCECGVGVSAQVKFPTQPGSGTLSSGSNDYTAMLNIGVPFWEDSGVWFSFAATKAGRDPVFQDWPMYDWLQMYEGTLNLGLTSGLGLLLQVRYESPLFRNEDLSYNYLYTSTRDQANERINSSWNSLVYGRGSEAAGFRYHWAKGNQVNLLMVEDWGRGAYDSTGAWTYINNAPDVEFITQWHFAF